MAPDATRRVAPLTMVRSPSTAWRVPVAQVVLPVMLPECQVIPLRTSTCLVNWATPFPPEFGLITSERLYHPS